MSDTSQRVGEATTETDVKTERLGPIHLVEGVTQLNAITKFYAAFGTIALLSGMSILQAYIVTEHLNVPRSMAGQVQGDLAFWAELVALVLMVPFGVLSDRIGRRPVFVFGVLVLAISFGLYPFATSYEELLIYRVIYGVGMAAAAVMIATLSNDYPQDRSRGKFIAVSSMMNTLGAIFISMVIAQIPAFVVKTGGTAIDGGKAMFVTVAVFAVLTAIVSQMGLKGGTAVQKRERPSVKELALSGLHHSRNPRIALSYAGAFAARSDLVIKALFITLWGLHDMRAWDLGPAAAMGRVGIILTIMSAVSFCIAPFFGWLIDRIHRVTAVIIALCFASTGYLSMGVITSPLDFRMVPFFIVLGLGSSFMMKSTLSLVGQEAAPKERGSIIAVNGTLGTLGILIFSKGGGWLFDNWGPASVFVVAGAYQAVLIAVAVAVRILAPGGKPYGKKRPGAAPAGTSADQDPMTSYSAAAAQSSAQRSSSDGAPGT